MESSTHRHRKGAVTYTPKRSRKSGSNPRQAKSTSHKNGKVKGSKAILEILRKQQLQIAHHLHEDLCQQLAAVTLLSEVLESKLSDKSLAEAADVGEIREIITQAIVQAKYLAKRLLAVKNLSTTKQFKYRKP